MNTFLPFTLCLVFFFTTSLFAQREDALPPPNTNNPSTNNLTSAELNTQKSPALNLAVRSAEFNTMIACQDTNLYKNLKPHSYFFNESFEKDKAKMGKMPTDWENCGAKGETPVDIHGEKYAYFGVTQKAQNGGNFVALVARKNNTVEGMGQRLQERLHKNTTYTFKLYLAHASKYLANMNKETPEQDYNKPVVLRIWGGSSSCEKSWLLAQTLPVEHQNWEEYTISFTGEEDVDFIILEAYFAEDKPYNGNILIDDISPIFKF